MSKRMRCWKSGCVAVVSLALAGIGDSWADDELDPRSECLQTSRHDLALTLQRLQTFAPRHGLAVMAHWAPRAAFVTGDESDRRSGIALLDRPSRSVLVFASGAGGTPVLMADDRARPDLPLSLQLRTRRDGVVEVLFHPLGRFGTDALPDELARDLTRLPALVREALG